MNLVEAVKSGKRFKRKDSQFWFLNTYVLPPGENPIVRISLQDIIADDWEILDLP